MRRGQATLFIILGIVILSLTSLVIFYKDSISREFQDMGLIKKTALESKSDQVTSKMNLCLEGLVSDAAFYVAKNGGYAEESKEQSYYAQGGKLTARSKKNVEMALADYVSQLAQFCIFDENFGFSVTPRGGAKAVAQMSGGKIEILVDAPIQILDQGASAMVSDFSATANSRLELIYNTAVKIADQHKDKDSICLSCIYSDGKNNNLNIEVYNPPGTQDAFFTITDEETNMVYNFAINLLEAQ